VETPPPPPQGMAPDVLRKKETKENKQDRVGRGGQEVGLEHWGSQQSPFLSRVGGGGLGDGSLTYMPRDRRSPSGLVMVQPMELSDESMSQDVLSEPG